MKIKFLSILLLGALLAAAAGCTKTATVYNVPNQNVQTNKDPHTEEDVKLAIIRAGGALGWQMYAEKSGNVVGTLHIRVHTAVVDISYDADSYNINYKDSDLLKYEAAGSEYSDVDGNVYVNEKAIIHKNYNVWIQGLDRAIKSQLLTL